METMSTTLRWRCPGLSTKTQLHGLVPKLKIDRLTLQVYRVQVTRKHALYELAGQVNPGMSRVRTRTGTVRASKATAMAIEPGSAQQTMSATGANHAPFFTNLTGSRVADSWMYRTE
jgi:hypothetical protein